MLTLWLIIVNWCVGSTLYEKTRYWKSQSPTGDDLKWKLVRDFWSGFSIVSLWNKWRCCCCPEVALLCLAPRNYDDLLGATWILPGPSEASWCSLSLPDRVFTCGFSGCQPVWEFHRWLLRVANLFGSFTDGYFGLPTCLGVSPMAFSGGHPGFSLAYHRLRLRFNVFDNA